ncbi:MAG: GNAT family N-acetyltransferase [Saprospiraceae bacterium]|nr:GNAT family N-acetyltransferase [Saprospiraceae bacterium]
MMKQILDKFFFAQSVAVIGATDKREKVGYAVLRNLLNGGYNGAIYPVNPKYKTVQGETCWPSVADLPQKPDLVVFATPAPTLPDLVKECGKAGIKAAIVVSAGFTSETKGNQKLLPAVQAAARRYGLRLMGPNSLGILTPAIGLNASLAPALPEAGRLALITESGALGAAILDWAAEKRVGFSHVAAVGGLADLGYAELIDYFGADSRTACILIYMEKLVRARSFLSAARAFARSKPIVVLRGGADNDEVFDAAFRRAGIIRVRTVQQLFDSAQALATQPLPGGKRLAIVSNAGGPATLAADALIRQGGMLAGFSAKTLEILSEVRPLSGQKHNPVDLLGDATPEHFRQAVRACLSDPQVDGVLTILTPQSVTDAAASARALVNEASQVALKPNYAAWMGQRSVVEGRKILEQNKLPWYPFPERGVTTFLYMARYRENLELLYEVPHDLPVEFPDIRRTEARNILNTIRQQGRLDIAPKEAAQLLQCYGIPTGKTAEKGRLLAIGADRDPLFGSVVRLGAGDELGNALPDHAAALPPLNLALAKHMVEDAMLLRFLPEKEEAREWLYTMLCRFAYLITDCADIETLRIPAFVLHESGGSALQCQGTLTAEPAAGAEPFAHLAIQPYPTQWIRRVTLKSGEELVLRPIRPEDTPLEAAMVKNVSRQSLYFRFFGYVPGLDEKQLSRFTHIDYDREMAIVAVSEKESGPEIVGVVRIVGDGWRESAEYAILVADAWHGHGLGSVLTDYILEIARAQGYKKITASFLKTNGAMRRLFERKKFKIRNGEDGADLADLTL